MRVMPEKQKDWNQKASTRLLKEAKKKNRWMRKMINVRKAKRNPDLYSIDFGVCWQCWLDLSGKMLDGWRREPYSEMKTHSKVCPLCGYDHWVGRVWFPFRFLRGYIGNPSSRYGIKENE